MPADPWSHPVRLAELSADRETTFDLAPDPAVQTALAAALGIERLRKLRFTGALRPEGRQDWRLEARLGATAVQNCVVTLAPVTTRIDESVIRRYLAELPPPPEGGETEMPEDDSAEPLPDTVDLGTVMAEALAIALPAYPRAPGAELGEAVFAEPGIAPMTDDDARPFAGLADLRDRLARDDD